MKSFPIIKRRVLEETFDSLVDLYSSERIKILNAASLALTTGPSPFVINAGPIDPQLATLRHKVRLTGGNQGRDALILLVEALHKDFIQHGAIGVNANDFCEVLVFKIKEGFELKYLSNGCWNLEWMLHTPQGDEYISIPLRKSSISQNDIVPHYLIQYVNQAIIAYENENYLTALSLISIALEGTLRDALASKGYTYTYGLPTNDSYEIKSAEISASQNGYNIDFQDAMPRANNDFLSEANQNAPHMVRVKRIQKNTNWFLEIRDAEYLKDFWSSDVINQQGQVNITGLGAALRVARDVHGANILDAMILATDIDDVIQQVRNNLIHLSGDAITNTIPAVGMSLEDFASDQARVFDTISSISDAIDKLYSKIADGTI
ncbi:hypothetical protein [Lacinutrix sp. MedPE-SW]|uniref:hypothetical protein n=1 Tax=Lacinutrix sp. MedPE-SW TaxID=1860087 RepID=UPI000913FA51|nr:hypothetical protein [Lacinutrix sp. MedPE-SW]OIQ24110.1 MAG: hypothetical protein BM549_02040 [Lacinutrix sp. MedPE-SW]